jgi:hypothetical protein
MNKHGGVLDHDHDPLWIAAVGGVTVRMIVVENVVVPVSMMFGYHRFW